MMMLIIVDVGDRKDLLKGRVAEGVTSNPHDFIGKCHHSSCCTHNILMSLLWLWRNKKVNPAEKLCDLYDPLEFVYLLNSPSSPHMKYMFPREKLTMTTSFPCFDECHWVRTPSKLMYAAIGKTGATSVLPRFDCYNSKTLLLKILCMAESA